MPQSVVTLGDASNAAACCCVGAPIGTGIAFAVMNLEISIGIIIGIVVGIIGAAAIMIDWTKH